MNDFKVTHRSATRVLKGENLYNMIDGHYLYKYSPFFAIMISPFGFIPFPWAKLLWMALMVLAFWGVVKIGKYLLMKHRSPPPFFYLLSLILIARFFLREIELGQTDFLQLFLIFSFFIFLEKERKVVSGLFLALSVMIKLTPLVFIPYLLYRKRFSTVFWSLAFILLFFSVPSLVYGIGGNIALLKDWYGFMSLSSPPLLANDMNQSIFGMFYRFLTPSAYQVNFVSLNPGLVNIMIYMIVVGAYVYLLFLNRFSRKAQSSLLHCKEIVEYSFLLIFMSLFSPLGWIQNFSSLVLAFMVLVYYTLKTSFKDKLVNTLLIFSFILSSAINYETVGRRLNDLSLYYSFIAIGIILIPIALSKLRLSRMA
ncbi:MAG: glycosyltransferase family 87 protein [Candidatus Zixiibacteriota bacterium]